MKFPKINLKIKLPKPDFHDFLILIGGIMFGKGLYMIYPPSMFIIVGAAIVWMGLPGKVVK